MKIIGVENLLRIAAVLTVALVLLCAGGGPWNLSFNTAQASDTAQIEVVGCVLGLGAVLLALIGLLPRRWALSIAYMFGLIG